MTTGFANLSDGAKVLIGTDDRAPTADLAPRKRSRSPDAKGGQGKDGQARGKRSTREGRARMDVASASAARAIRRDKPDRHRRRPGWRRSEVAAMTENVVRLK